MLDLTPIQERLAAATPGPWQTSITQEKESTAECVTTPRTLDLTISKKENWRRMMEAEICKMIAISQETADQRKRDAQFIAYAPTDIAALIDEVERLRALVGKQ